MSGRRIRGLRWWIIGLVMAGTTLNFLTRAVLGVVAPTMNADLGLDEWHYSWITSAFQIGIMCQPLAGYLLDRLGLRAGLALFAAAWGAITMAHGLGNGWRMLAGLRGALGFAEGAGASGRAQGRRRIFPGAGARPSPPASTISALRWAGCSPDRSSMSRRGYGAGAPPSLRPARWRSSGRSPGGFATGGARRTPRSAPRSARISRRGRRRICARPRPSRPSRPSSASAISGASRCRASSPTRPGER